MAIWVGTSGYNYPEWKGTFYPQTLPAAKMLPYYAERFPTVEINYTFYRAPNEKILDGWSKATHLNWFPNTTMEEGLKFTIDNIKSKII